MSMHGADMPDDKGPRMTAYDLGWNEALRALVRRIDARQRHTGGALSMRELREWADEQKKKS